MSLNRRAFLYAIAFSELGAIILNKSDDGYNVLVGSTPQQINTFQSYKDHPRQLISVKMRNGATVMSSAAGRYQIMRATYDAYRLQLKLADFGKASQDAIALQLIAECKAIDDMEAGRFDVAIVKCKSRWASLPGAGYGQPENKIADLRNAFVKAGGVLA